MVIAIGALYAWHWRFYVNPDGVGYYDVADTFLSRGWFAAIHTHRDPVYPVLLAMANRLFHVTPYWESTAAHAVTFFMYCAAFVALEFLLAQLGNAMLVPIAYALFLWGCNFATATGPSVLSPDLLAAAGVFAGSALVARIAGGRRGWTTYAALGATLGLGYLSKEAMLPIGVFLLLAAAAAGGRRALPRIALAAVLFAGIACFYIVPLSMKLGRFSAGESSRYNLILWVASAGRPLHARPVIFRDPLIVMYPPGVAPGSYAVHDDLRYWLDGMRPRFDLRTQLRRMRHSIGDYSEMLRVPLHLALLVVFLALLFSAENRLEPLRRYWFLTLPSIATMAMYATVLVLPRYVSPSITVLWLALFAGFGVETLRRAARLMAAAGVAVFLAIFTNREVMTEWQLLRQPALHENWLLAERLRQSGVRPGDHVAVVNPPYMCYWARLAKVRIAAEVMEPQKFWAAGNATRGAAIEALQRAGIRAIVADDESEHDVPCFDRVDDTSFLVCVPSAAGLAFQAGFDFRPVLIAPRLFGLRDQILRDAAMDQHELRPAIRRWRQRDRGHREDALGKAAVAPGLNDASPGDQVDVDSRDIVLVDGERPPNLPADDRAPAGEGAVLSRVGQQLVDRRRIGLELHPLFDGLAHGCLRAQCPPEPSSD